MLKRLKLKQNEKGLTLIELLVVIVILGIIAAIAILAIGGIIDNSKKDAHIANAQQMANAAKLYVAAQDMNITTTTSKKITLSNLITENYMDAIKDPSNGDKKYSSTASQVEIKKSGTSYVYIVTLKSEDGTVNYLIADPKATPKQNEVPDANDLKRGNVVLP